jgi:phage major head subunit gpT-like protein
MRVIISTFALGYRVTMEAQRDAQYNVIEQMPSDLGDAGRHHQETLAWGLLNDGFAAATYTGLDGLALYSASHTSLKGAGLRSNRITPGVQLSVSLLEDMFTNLRTTQSDAGRQTPLTPAFLIIHPNEAHEAARLLESEFEPNTSENQINVMRSSRTGIMPVDTPYLTDVDAVHLWSAKGKHSVSFHMRSDFEFSNSTDTQTKDRLYDAMYRAQVAFFAWEGTVGSQP